MFFFSFPNWLIGMIVTISCVIFCIFVVSSHDGGNVLTIMEFPTHFLRPLQFSVGLCTSL